MKLSTTAFLIILGIALFCIPPSSSKGGRGGGGGSRSSSSGSSSSRSSSSGGYSHGSSSSSRSNSGSYNSGGYSSGGSSYGSSNYGSSSYGGSSSSGSSSGSSGSIGSNSQSSSLGGSNSGSSRSGISSSSNVNSIRTSSVNAKPSAPELPVINPSAPKATFGQKASPLESNAHPYNPHFSGSNTGIGNSGNPPPYGASAGGLGNPSPYGTGSGSLGNPPPYGASAGGFGNPSPYGPGSGSLGNPPPYGAGTGGLGNPPPYGVGTGNFGNRPPYGSGIGNVPTYTYGSGKAPPHGSGPSSLGNNPHFVGSGNRYPYGPLNSGYPSKYGTHSGSETSAIFGAPSYSGYAYVPGTKPYKRKSFLGSFLSPGKGSKHSKYPKTYGHGFSHTQYGIHETRKYSVSPMYAILPSRALNQTPKPYRPNKYLSHWFMPRGTRRRGWRRKSYFDFDSDDRGNFAGRRCMKPFPPTNGNVSCVRTSRGMICSAECSDGYVFHNDTSKMRLECWHFSGYWEPTRYIPECKPFCKKQCENGGVCIPPEECRCSAEYRGPQCQYHFLRCDVKKITVSSRIAWVCSHSAKETKCSVTCRPPRVFASPPAEEYHCYPNGTWVPDTIPDCIEQPRLEDVKGL